MLLFEQLAQKVAQRKGDTPGCGGEGDTPVCGGGGAQGTGYVDLPNVFGVRKRAWMEDYGEMPIVAQVCKKNTESKIKNKNHYVKSYYVDGRLLPSAGCCPSECETLQRRRRG